MRHARSRALLGLVVALLAGCDSGGPDPDDLVGTWTLAESTPHAYATTARAVTYTDLLAPGTGAVAASGDATMDLRYVTYVEGPLGPQASAIQVQSYPRAVFGYPTTALRPAGPWAELLIRFGGETYLHVGRGTTVSGTFGPVPTRGISVSGTALTVRPLVLPGQEGGTVTIQGVLTFVQRALRAGDEIEVYPDHVRSLGTDTFRSTFNADGTFQTETEYGAPDPYTLKGRWESKADSVFISLLYNVFGAEIPPSTTRHKYSVIRGELILQSRVGPFCTGTCLRNMERRLFLPEGSLATARDEFHDRYVPNETP